MEKCMIWILGVWETWSVSMLDLYHPYLTIVQEEGWLQQNSVGTPSYSSKPAEVCIWIPYNLCSRKGGIDYRTHILPIFLFTAFGEGWKCDVFLQHQIILSSVTNSNVSALWGILDKSERPLKLISIILLLKLKAKLQQLSGCAWFFIPRLASRRQDHHN